MHCNFSKKALCRKSPLKPLQVFYIYDICIKDPIRGNNSSTFLPSHWLFFNYGWFSGNFKLWEKRHPFTSQCWINTKLKQSFKSIYCRFKLFFVFNGSVSWVVFMAVWNKEDDISAKVNLRTCHLHQYSHLCLHPFKIQSVFLPP